MILDVYLNNNNTFSTPMPLLKKYGGLSSYKNVKSSNYNRHVCWQCHDFKGFPQTPGLYDLNVVYPQPNVNNVEQTTIDNYKIYQTHRLSNHPGKYNSNYVNYLNYHCHHIHPS